MKTTKSTVRLSDRLSLARQREARREIQSFLRALHSYPEQVARTPHINFQQHLFSIVAARQSDLRRRNYSQ